MGCFASGVPDHLDLDDDGDGIPDDEEVAVAAAGMKSGSKGPKTPPTKVAVKASSKATLSSSEAKKPNTKASMKAALPQTKDTDSDGDGEPCVY